MVGGGEVPGTERKKEVTTWYPAYAYIPENRRLPVYLPGHFFCAMPSARTYSQSHGSIRHTTAFVTIYDSKTLNNVTDASKIVLGKTTFLKSRMLLKITLKDLSEEIQRFIYYFSTSFFSSLTFFAFSDIPCTMFITPARKNDKIFT